MFNKLASIIMISAIAFWLGGCSESTTIENNGNIDTTPPILASVTPIDLFHMEVTFSEAVDKATAEHLTYYEIYKGTFTASSGQSRTGLARTVSGDTIEC